jgi:hypothetical protein
MVRRSSLSIKLNTQISSFSPEAYFNGWRNSFPLPVSSKTAAAATSFFRLLSKSPAKRVFRQHEAPDQWSGAHSIAVRKSLSDFKAKAALKSQNSIKR